METAYYLDKFQKIANDLDQQHFSEKKLESKVGIWLHSVALKVQKRSWINASQLARPFEESIFFSVWVNDESARTGKLYYNIHALKLRQLTGYKIKSRDFATAFRMRFKAFEMKWPNVRLDLGPLTLMEGWVVLDEEHFAATVKDLTYNFSAIAFIIDELLEERKIPVELAK
ncbi:hypothetical protein SAMN04488505_1102 [Chitinophaga rupis]|uniref:Uncharacterized protein n=1 Tax=Chitinophaga rupis TaxID=573321 RepID=A0A1H8G3C5_9BACT|nr:hypothetical protein [Chitinophaga rupis]SEN37788.1 hypothetical protein SAMN04488505_1102 [Chitinophaga rupis]